MHISFTIERNYQSSRLSNYAVALGHGYSNSLHVSYEAEKCINLSRCELQFSRDQRNQVQVFTSYHQSIQHVQLLFDGVASKYKRKNCEKGTKKLRK